MIHCQLIHVSRTPQGKVLRNELSVSGETLSIGRGAACKIHLPDHRVCLHHATILRNELGELSIEVAGDSTLKVNGFVTESASLTQGTVVEIGPYVLQVEAAANGFELALLVDQPAAEQVQGLADEYQIDRVSVASLGWSKRKLSWRLLGLIFVLFFLLPMLPRWMPAVEAWQTEMPMGLSETWLPGPMLLGHRSFAAKCATCHQQGFKTVTDEACTACHKNMVQHIADPSTRKREAGRVQCVACHADHKGPTQHAKHDSTLCVNCHHDLASVKAGTRFADVPDFSKRHPQFHLTIPNARDKEPELRERQDAEVKITEPVTLKFPHKLHLSKKGFITPYGKRVLICQDCHHLGEGGNHFDAMEMERDCQTGGCHAIEVIGDVEVTLPHGSEYEAMHRLSYTFSRWLAESAENRAACTSVRKKGVACAEALTLAAAEKNLFEEGMGCGQCHLITASNDTSVPWRIVPLKLQRDWHAGATFPHVKHGTIECEACHDKAESKSSADVSMPRIETCRKCHEGEQAKKGKTAVYCDSCHRYHKAR